MIAAAWPPATAEAILDAFERLRARVGASRLLVSVRSSAVGEDGEFSFAGQYTSILNVDRDHLLEACKQVVASQFGPRAVIYYKARGLDAPRLPMAIGVVEMVDARASGVLYTRSPTAPAADAMILTGAWGLGPFTVEGVVTPDVFTVSRSGPHEVIEARVARKDRMLLCQEGAGVVAVPVPGWMRSEPCVTREQVAALAAAGLRLEDQFEAPQDVEWAVDAAERVLVLQSRRLTVEAAPGRSPDAVAARKSLAVLASGAIASPGVAAGPVVAVRTEDDRRAVPAGAVVVAHLASPDLAEVLDRAAAVVTEVGSVASHLATVAREFHVPALVTVPDALSRLPAGGIVTVDAEMGDVYPGRVDALLDAGTPRRAERDLLDAPLFRRLRGVTALLTPLNLVDPRARDFRPAGCRTLHDVLRYAHETGVQEMFLAGSTAAGSRDALRLESAVPLDFFVIDLGGGLDVPPGAASVGPAAFRSRPLVELWRGIERAAWDMEPAVAAGGFGQLMMAALSSREAARPQPNFVLVTGSYVNLTVRLGYHFSRVDAYLSEAAGDNYASLVFHGGAADASGRSRRLDFLSGVLSSRAWRVSRREDALFGRTEGLPPSDLAAELAVLGRLLVLTRQIDMLLADDDTVRRAVAAFAAGDDTLGLPGTGTGGAP